MQPTPGGRTRDEINDDAAQSPQRTDVDARKALLMAVQLHQQGSLDAAQELYKRLLKLDPCNANALHCLGVLLHARGQSDEAIECIRRSIALDPGVPDWYADIGNVMLQGRRLEDAADAYATPFGLAPDNAAILNNLGALRRVQQRFPEARAAEQPDNPLPSHHLAACTGEAVPDGTDDDYVEAVFDAFAESLNGRLEAVADAAHEALPVRGWWISAQREVPPDTH